MISFPTFWQRATQFAVDMIPMVRWVMLVLCAAMVLLLAGTIYIDVSVGNHVGAILAGICMGAMAMNLAYTLVMPGMMRRMTELEVQSYQAQLDLVFREAMRRHAEAHPELNLHIERMQ